MRLNSKIEITKGGKLAVECVSNDTISLKCLFSRELRVFCRNEKTFSLE